MNKNKNKGFTLVELIIVVAIIAVLAAVLAPQYLQYVERSRESNDLQIATNMVRAATVAIADPKNEIPAGYYVEVLWITGDESGSYANSGELMVRYGQNTNRYSIYNSGDSADNVPTLPANISLEAFAYSLIEIMGGEVSEITVSGAGNGYTAPIQDALSSLANEYNFAFHINTTTGEVALAKLGNEPIDGINGWVELGVDAVPAI